MATPISSSLSRIERLTLFIAASVNRSARWKRLLHGCGVGVNYRFTRVCSARRVHVIGLEHVLNLSSERGVLLAANHRSFFDFYLVMTYYWEYVRRCERFYFPVRSSFWYDSVPGLVINGVASSFSMFPPIFRESEKRAVTREGLKFLARELEKPGTVVGMHPEGTRSQGADPYTLLAPERSFGRVVLSAQPLVIPVFINGIGNSLASELRDTLSGRGEPIVIVFGPAVELEEFRDADPLRLRTQLEVGAKVLAAISKLGTLERNTRATLTSTQICGERCGDESPVVRETDVTA